MFMKALKRGDFRQKNYSKFAIDDILFPAVR